MTAFAPKETGMTQKNKYILLGGGLTACVLLIFCIFFSPFHVHLHQEHGIQTHLDDQGRMVYPTNLADLILQNKRATPSLHDLEEDALKRYHAELVLQGSAYHWSEKSRTPSQEIWAQYDLNQDQQIDCDEFKAVLRTLLYLFDLNHDHHISSSERAFIQIHQYKFIDPSDILPLFDTSTYRSFLLSHSDTIQKYQKAYHE